jgi:1-aminocyclopropane-1-carboxylate deaminase/D-cysteine desulfhydrase-like pyridoxal-dependent ACC family enzyme
VFGHLPRARLATLPTPLERGPELPGGTRLWVKRDDLTGLGMGGNKARKLEYLCGAAIAAGARSLVTVGRRPVEPLPDDRGGRCGARPRGAPRAGRRSPPATLVGNQLLSAMFGAQLHHTGASESHWGELEIAREALTDELTAAGAQPYPIPIGGSTATGAVGYAAAFFELMDQCDAGDPPGGDRVHLVQRRHARRPGGGSRDVGGRCRDAPEVLAIGVAKGVNLGMPDVHALARDTVELAGGDPALVERRRRAHRPDWMGDDYAVPTAAGDAAIRWAARHGGWVLDRVYSGKGFAGLVGNAEQGRWPVGSDVVFIHTGGHAVGVRPGRGAESGDAVAAS